MSSCYVFLTVSQPGLGGHVCGLPSLGRECSGRAQLQVLPPKESAAFLHAFINSQRGKVVYRLRPETLESHRNVPLLSTIGAHLRLWPTSFFPFSLAPVEKPDSAAEARAAPCPGWAGTPTVWDGPRPEPLRKGAGGRPRLEKQVVWDTPVVSWSVWPGQRWWPSLPPLPASVSPSRLPHKRMRMTPADVDKDLCSSTSTATLFILVKTSKQPKCPTAIEKITV